MNVQRQRSGFDSYHIHQYHLHINGLTEVGTSPPPPITSAFQVLQESARSSQQQQRPSTSAKKINKNEIEFTPATDAISSTSSAATPSQILQSRGLVTPKNRRRAKSHHSSSIRRNNIFQEISLDDEAEDPDELRIDTQLHDLRAELYHQGDILSRVVRDIHIHHENKHLDNDNSSVHGLEMVLSEIRSLREELKEHRTQLDCLRDDVNAILLSQQQEQ